MKVFVVMRTEYSPDHDYGVTEYRSVEFVTSSEETATKFCLENKPYNNWSPSFEVEESEMR